MNVAQKIHETGIFICFSLSGLWVRARQKTSSESKILIKKTVSFGERKTKHRNHVGKDFKADGILWLFLNNCGFRSVKELVCFVVFSQLFFLKLFRINTSSFFEKNLKILILTQTIFSLAYHITFVLFLLVSSLAWDNTCWRLMQLCRGCEP